MIDHPDFFAKDLDQLDDVQKESTSNRQYKKVELYSDEIIKRMTLQLDKEQRIILDIAVDYAKNIIKARKGKNVMQKPPLLIVQGGAGSGKSFLIDVISQHLEKNLRYSGDCPDHPYILKLAFTGTAAANIQGQTLHSAFSFGNEFLSLGDKAREEKTSQPFSFQGN